MIKYLVEDPDLSDGDAGDFPPFSFPHSAASPPFPHPSFCPTLASPVPPLKPS